MAEENAKTAQRRASIAEDRATVSHKKSIIDEKRANVTEERATATEKRASVAEERAKVAEMEVIAAVMKATAADTRANGLEERTNQAEGEVKTLQESARISDIRMAELVQTNSCRCQTLGHPTLHVRWALEIIAMQLPRALIVPCNLPKWMCLAMAFLCWKWHVVSFRKCKRG